MTSEEILAGSGLTTGDVDRLQELAREICVAAIAHRTGMAKTHISKSLIPKSLPLHSIWHVVAHYAENVAARFLDDDLAPSAKRLMATPQAVRDAASAKKRAARHARKKASSRPQQNASAAPTAVAS